MDDTYVIYREQGVTKVQGRKPTERDYAQRGLKPDECSIAFAFTSPHGGDITHVQQGRVMLLGRDRVVKEGERVVFILPDRPTLRRQARSEV